MLRLFTHDDNVLREIDCRTRERGEAILCATWIDALNPDNEEKQLLSGFLTAGVPDPEDVAEIEDSARCFIDQAGIHVHSLFYSQQDGIPEVFSVACVLQPERLITIRDEKIAAFRLFRMRAKRGQLEAGSPSALLVSLLEQKVEILADLLEDIHRELESLSTHVLGNAEHDPALTVSRLARQEDRNGKVRLCLMDTQRDISFLQRHMRADESVNATCREIARDIDTLMSHTTFLFDKINFLMDFTQGHINLQQNRIIKIFSIASVVFLPPTLVASIYGMNFALMPELQWAWGYPIALVLMLASGVAPYWFFKKKGWL